MEVLRVSLEGQYAARTERLEEHLAKLEQSA